MDMALPSFGKLPRGPAHGRDDKAIAETADEGLRLARAHRPEAIVLDMVLPDQSGLLVEDESIQRGPRPPRRG